MAYTKEQRKQYRASHREEIKKYQKQYCQTPAGKEANRKHVNKHRQLGFNPLNDFFEGSEAHHINENDIVYMPKDLHRSIKHNIWTGKNMKEINSKAVEWCVIQANKRKHF